MKFHDIRDSQRHPKHKNRHMMRIILPSVVSLIVTNVNTEYTSNIINALVAKMKWIHPSMYPANFRSRHVKNFFGRMYIILSELVQIN